MVKTSFA
jgi:hypothetical protein